MTVILQALHDSIEYSHGHLRRKHSKRQARNHKIELLDSVFFHVPVKFLSVAVKAEALVFTVFFTNHFLECRVNLEH